LKIHNIEAHHFNQDVESLVRGQSMASVGGDLEFMLRYVPNHHRALYSLVKLALRDKTEMPYQTNPYTVRCWLQRGAVFSPEDGTVFLISGIYLGRLGRIDEAIAALERANELLPDDENVQYNLGLLYFDKKDFARSLSSAKRAYAAGFPLPGLRRKLEQAGQWRD
jgi:tetratricopeptide (TPR) repeat protein